MQKVFLFDAFGTVFDMSSVPRSEIGDYIKQVKAKKWQPLDYPPSWESLRAWTDARLGIQMLRENSHIVCTMSNAPVELLVRLSVNNDINWDLIVPIELRKVYKPNPSAYLLACEMLNVQPEQCVMVTANPTFGDVEAAKALGMSVEIIARYGTLYRDCIGLAESYAVVKDEHE